MPSTDRLKRRSSALVDAKGTLYAQLNARLVRPALLDVASDTSTKLPSPQSPDKSSSEDSYRTGKAQANKGPKDEKIFTTLRRGGR